jgi:hypothetical protein
MGLLSITDVLQLWHVAVLMAVYGAGNALFSPAFDALVPDVVPPDILTQANAVDQFVRPAALRLIGPALGGWLIGVLGIGPAVLINAGTFVISIVLVLCLNRHQLVSHHHEPDESSEGVLADLKEGFRFVRHHVWLWGTFLAATFAYLLFMGPTEVLLPFVVRNIMHGSALDLGFVFASGGVGAICAAIVVGRHGLPRRYMTFIYIAWTASTMCSGLWARQVLMAGNDRQVCVQSLRDGRHGCVADYQAALRASRPARPRLELRLVHIDRLGSCLVCAHGTGRRGLWRACDLMGAGVLGSAMTLAFLFCRGCDVPKLRLWPPALSCVPMRPSVRRWRQSDDPTLVWLGYLVTDVLLPSSTFGARRRQRKQELDMEQNTDENGSPKLHRVMGTWDLVLLNIAIVTLRWFSTAAQIGPSSLTLWGLGLIVFSCQWRSQYWS